MDKSRELAVKGEVQVNDILSLTNEISSIVEGDSSYSGPMKKDIDSVIEEINSEANKVREKLSTYYSRNPIDKESEMGVAVDSMVRLVDQMHTLHGLTGVAGSPTSHLNPNTWYDICMKKIKIILDDRICLKVNVMRYFC